MQTVDNQCRPSARPIAINRDENDVDEHSDQCATNGNVGAKTGLTAELVPNRLVEINPQKDIGNEQNRHDAQAHPIVLVSDEILENIDVQRNAQEDNTHRRDEVIHDLGVQFESILVVFLSEEKRLGGIAIGLQENGNNHRQFIDCAVNSDFAQRLCSCFSSIHQERFHHHTVEGFVGNSCKSSNHEWKGILQHFSTQFHIVGNFEPDKILIRSNNFHPRGKQIRDENEQHTFHWFVFIEQNEHKKQVQQNVDRDGCKMNECKLSRLLFRPQFCHGNGRDGVNADHQSEYNDELAVFRIAH